MVVVFLVVLLFLALIGVGTYFVLTMNNVSMEDIAEKMISIDKEYPQIKLVPSGQLKADIVKKLKNPHASDKDKVKLFISVFTEGINKELNNLEMIQLWYDKIVKKFKHSRPAQVAIFERILGIAQTVAPTQAPTPVPTGATTSAPTPAPAEITTPAPTPA